MNKNYEHKRPGDNTGEKVRRLVQLVNYLAAGRNGRTMDDILKEVYGVETCEISEKNNTYKSAEKRFRRDKDHVKYIFSECKVEAGHDEWVESSDEDDDDDEYRDPQNVYIDKDENGRYHLKNMKCLLPLNLKDWDDDESELSNEVIALECGLHLAGHLMPCFKEGADAVSNRIERYMTEGQQETVGYLKKALTIAMPVSGVDDVKAVDTFKNVLKAIRDGRILHIGRYTARNGKTREERVRPLIMYFKYHSWYIWARSAEKLQPQSFRLTRMKDVTLEGEASDEYYEDTYVDKKMSKEYFSTYDRDKEKEKLLNEVRLDYDPNANDGNTEGKVYHIKLRIHPTYSFAANDNIEWFPGEIKSWDPDEEGVLIYEVALLGLDDITRWILRAVDCFEVIEPQELKDKIREKIETYLNRCR